MTKLSDLGPPIPGKRRGGEPTDKRLKRPFSATVAMPQKGQERSLTKYLEPLPPARALSPKPLF